MIPHKLNRDQMNNLNKPIIPKNIKAVTKTLPIKNRPGTHDFIPEIYHTLKEELPGLLKLFCKIEKDATFSNSFYETTVILIPKSYNDSV